CAIPVEHLDLTAIFVTKHEECGIVNIQRHCFADDERQPIDRFPKINRSAMKVAGKGTWPGDHARDLTSETSDGMRIVPGERILQLPISKTRPAADCVGCTTTVAKAPASRALRFDSLRLK